MNIKVFTDFTKRKNSTRQPSGGQNINCVLKEDTSILRPVFILDTPIASYTYVQAFGKYYFVSDVVNLDASRCEVHCVLDVLATYKADIAAYPAFVERAASAFDVFVNDPLLSQKQLLLRETQNLTEITDFFDTGAGCFLVECLAKDLGIVLYATNNLDPYRYILAPGVYTAQDKQQWIQSTIAQSFDLDVYIGHVKWFPFRASTLGTEPTDGGGNKIFPIGPIDIAAALGGAWDDHVYRVSQSGTKHKQLTLRLPSTNNFNDFRDCNNNYTQYTLYMPGVGLVPLDASVIGYAINNGRGVQVDIYVDLVSGEITYLLRLQTEAGYAGALIGRYSGNISVDVPIGKSAVDVTKSAKMLAGSIGAGAAAGGWVGAIGGALVGAVEAIYNHMTPDTSMIGGAGNKTEIFFNHDNLVLGRKQFGSKDFPTEVAGRPFMQNIVLGNLSGFVKCGGASVPVNAPDQVRDEINRYLNNGFYME